MFAIPMDDENGNRLESTKSNVYLGLVRAVEGIRKDYPDSNFYMLDAVLGAMAQLRDAPQIPESDEGVAMMQHFGMRATGVAAIFSAFMEQPIPKGKLN